MNKKEPLIRLAKRDDIGTVKAWIIRIASILVALILFGILILAVALTRCLFTPLCSTVRWAPALIFSRPLKS